MINERNNRFPFFDHLTMAQVMEMEALEAKKASGAIITGGEAGRLYRLQCRFVAPIYDRQPQDGPRTA